MKRLILLFLLTIFAGVSLFAQIDLQPVAIVQLVRSEPITVRQLRAEVEREQRRMNRSLSMDERREILDVMINQRLLLQAVERVPAEHRSMVTYTDNELNQQMNDLRSQLAQQLGRAPTEAEFAREINNQFGYEVPAFREEIRRQAVTERYLLYSKGDIINSVQEPTEADILRLYNLNRTQFVQPDTIRFDMIQILFGDDAASRARARQLADQLSREISGDPGRFDMVVLRAHTPNSGYNAGDFGFLPYSTEAQALFGTAFMDTAFNLRQGQVSGIIESIQGFLIIKVTANHAMRNLGLDDILLGATPPITVREFIRRNLITQSQTEAVARATQLLIEELRAEGTVQVMENNLRNW